MLKKLLILILFSFLVMGDLESKIIESKVKTTNASEFLDRESCENHNLDIEICDFIRTMYSGLNLDSIYMDSTGFTRDNPNFTKNRLKNPFFVSLLTSACERFDALSDKNLQYIMQQNFVFNDIYTGQERALLPNVDVSTLRGYFKVSCDDIKSDIADIEKKKTIALNTLMDSIFASEKRSQAKYDKNVEWVFKSTCEKKRVSAAVCEFANVWWNFSRLNESDMSMGDDVIKLFLSFSKDGCEVSKKLTKQDKKFILKLNLDYNGANLSQDEQFFLMCDFYEKSKGLVE
ncbi:hypothetical protein DCO58_01150 [Helicobacter saguini]|uniref:Uncharacterized protein n=1 Tax=Helicobacter saguini TaxID=1548018 RepID=A0A347VR80_9HELI|nr:hypothetical protein [Helicobacter saguini]MWV63004.1 hypothetical protein [Helicobacter saguini]MWV66327.1 hypothetical protein [Helicobacter saguini]MWV68679.1 hypothetical protein [Helicobacter saguini]MWV71770.1 hypothetical protein [Helicobacter saguini]TLD95799.1 hypothetical protein LS64_000035 [Helicobacter saguini]